MKNNKGFELVDVMIFIVIIGMLTAMAIPAYHKIRESNNTHQTPPSKLQVELPRSINTDVNNPIGTEVVLNGKVYIIIEKKY